MKICIAHFRVGLTDGVSLQIDERANILHGLGHNVFYIADNNSPLAQLKIDYLNYKANPQIKKLQKLAFHTTSDNSHYIKTKLSDFNEMYTIAENIEEKIEDFWQRYPFSLIFIHNLFSLPVCLPATIAFYNFLVKHSHIDAIGVHHDFYWDPLRKDNFYPSNSHIKHILRDYFPPKIDNLRHTVISKWEQKKLDDEKDIKSEVVTDTLDFDQESWDKNQSNVDFPTDVGLTEKELVLVIASRIRNRKGIELGIDFVYYLGKLISEQKFLLPNGKKKVVLILPNDYTENEKVYVDLLKDKINDLNVDVRWIQDLVGSVEEKKRRVKKYSLFDSYVYSDVVIYPSLWEGFGNQFLEGVFAKKPIVVFEYPVFKTDIKPVGFNYISLGDEVRIDENGLAKVDKNILEGKSKELIKLLSNQLKLQKLVDKNFNLGKKKFNTGVQLKKYLSQKSRKYIKMNGVRSVASPLLLTGKLIAAGVPIQHAYEYAESVIGNIQNNIITSEEFFILIVRYLPDEYKKRYVTLEIAKDYLMSSKSSSPLFIFLGGMAGKTTLSNFVVEQLSIDQPVAYDREKYHIAKPGESAPFLWKATYESQKGYLKTVNILYPHFVQMINRCLFDFKRYKKWCYFWEGIYLTGDLVKKLHEENKKINYLSVFILPKFSDIKKQYIIRWQNEMGTEKLRKRRNIIDKYLKNVSAIRSHIASNMDPIASFVIESNVLEERLSTFYGILYQRLKDITDKEIPGWVEKISGKPELIRKYKKFLKK